MNAPPNEMGAAPAPATAPDTQPDTHQTEAFSRSTLPPGALAPVAELVAAMPDPAAEVELRRRLCREAYLDGCREGWRRGVEHGARLRAAEWPAIVAPLSQPDQAELELLRYGRGGREHFGDSQPGDYIPQTRLEAAS